jgi:glycosyltransferase involved in cell wall biosynthesis
LNAGSSNHFDIHGIGDDDDFSHVNDAIIKSIKDYKWVFLGSMPKCLTKYIKSGDIEFHDWTMIPNYPKAIYDLNVNAVVAPLLDCTFNKAKSNIKFLESACLGIPGVFQDIVTYKDAPLRFTDGKDMINKLNKLFDSRQYYVKLSKQARMYADKMWLDDHLDIYSEIYF